MPARCAIEMYYPALGTISARFAGGRAMRSRTDDAGTKLDLSAASGKSAGSYQEQPYICKKP
jgi:hypothetical protein